MSSINHTHIVRCDGCGATGHAGTQCKFCRGLLKSDQPTVVQEQIPIESTKEEDGDDENGCATICGCLIVFCLIFLCSTVATFLGIA
ncbi:MAG: hypothetical protein FWC81_02020 [Coriobacteriia bacterium]|nr:hypothetical protein [Coriobacteriia bacterium]